MIWNKQTVRDVDRESIRGFMERCRGYLVGRVLDFGCGAPGTCLMPQPYRDLVTGEYVGHDIAAPASLDGEFDAVMCNQVLQYVPSVPGLLDHLVALLKPGGHLVITYATNWAEVESSDLWRFTKAGMERLLGVLEVEILHHERRAEIDLNGFVIPIGYGVVAKKNA